MFSAVGTLEYAAPEIHKANPKVPEDKGYSKAVDMWSIGSVTTALLSGDVLFTDRYDPRYYRNPKSVIMDLASECDLSILDDGTDRIWASVGHQPKEFIRKLLVLDENDRMTAQQALAHPWFSNEKHAADFEALYKRSIQGWKPRPKAPRLVERIRKKRTKSSHPPHSSESFSLASIVEEDDGAGPEDPDTQPGGLPVRKNLIQIPNSTTSEPSTIQPSVPSNPPASGMYPTSEIGQDSNSNDPSPKQYPIDIDTAHLIIRETPIDDSNTPSYLTDMGDQFIPETPIKRRKKRPPPAPLRPEGYYLRSKAQGRRVESGVHKRVRVD
jgi:serine/threonine protein kinase